MSEFNNPIGRPVLPFAARGHHRQPVQGNLGNCPGLGKRRFQADIAVEAPAQCLGYMFQHKAVPALSVSIQVHSPAGTLKDPGFGQPLQPLLESLGTVFMENLGQVLHQEHVAPFSAPGIHSFDGSGFVHIVIKYTIRLYNNSLNAHLMVNQNNPCCCNDDHRFMLAEQLHSVGAPCHF